MDTKSATDVVDVLNCGDDRRILKQLREESSTLVLMVRMENEKRKEEWKQRGEQRIAKVAASAGILLSAEALDAWMRHAKKHRVSMDNLPSDDTELVQMIRSWAGGEQDDLDTLFDVNKEF